MTKGCKVFEWIINLDYWKIEPFTNAIILLYFSCKIS